ncbi:MAG: hypothetical protein QNK37_01530 [Acidobacteriota bacterium]|nr:hypothetical protein [Acidobacteriota bacterium]
MKKKVVFIALLLTGILAAAQAQGPGRGHLKNADTNGDGQISAEEFAAATQLRFEKMDANGDGVLTEDEFGRRGRHGKARMGKRGGHRGGHHGLRGGLIALADSDQDGNITTDEWSAFLASVTADDGETIDHDKVRALLPENRGHRHRENPPTITVADAQAAFERMDADDDGVVSADEMPRGRMRGMRRALGAMILLEGADTDGEPGLTADEWSTFLANLDEDGDGAFTSEQLAALIHANLGLEQPPEGRGPRMIDRFDSDGDGTPDIAGLQAAFNKLDANGDGAITEDELPPMRRHGHRGRRHH